MYAEGNYTCRITNQQVTEANSGTIQLELEVLPIKADDEPIDGNVFRRIIYLPLTPKTIGTKDDPGWVTNTLRGLGFQGDDFTALQPDNANSQSLIGKEVSCYCKHEEWDERTREKWSFSKSRSKDKKKASTEALAALSGPTDRQQPPAKDIPF